MPATERKATPFSATRLPIPQRGGGGATLRSPGIARCQHEQDCVQIRRRFAARAHTDSWESSRPILALPVVQIVGYLLRLIGCRALLHGTLPGWLRPRHPCSAGINSSCTVRSSSGPEVSGSVEWRREPRADDLLQASTELVCATRRMHECMVTAVGRFRNRGCVAVRCRSCERRFK